MKQYKVGDTIYIKDTVKEIDHNPETYAKYSTLENNWIDNDTIIDELPTSEPVKPVLPKDVAKELEITKKLNVTFDGYIMRVIDDQSHYTNSHTFWMNSDDGVIKILIDAWYNGYTVEKPKLYNLVLGKNMWGWPLALYKPTGNDNNLIAYPDAAPKYLRDSVYQFTQEEIDKYNKSFWIKNIDLNDYKVEVTADIQTKEVEE